MSRYLFVIAASYLLTATPIAGAWLAGRMSPLYRLPRTVLLRWWGWAACTAVVCAWVLRLAAA